MDAPPFTEKLRKACRTKLLSCLADLVDRASAVEKEADGKKVKVVGVASDGEPWVSKLFNTYLELSKDSKHAKPVNDVGDDENRLVRDAAETIEKLRKVSNRADHVIRTT